MILKKKKNYYNHRKLNKIFIFKKVIVRNQHAKNSESKKVLAKINGINNKIA